jgi:hypothetical protein
LIEAALKEVAYFVLEVQAGSFVNQVAHADERVGGGRGEAHPSTFSQLAGECDDIRVVVILGRG